MFFSTLIPARFSSTSCSSSSAAAIRNPRFSQLQPSICFIDRSFRRSLHMSTSQSSYSSSIGSRCCLRPIDETRKNEPVIHGVCETVVGVLGGGQLGRMLCQAASKMAIKVITLDPHENCPASSFSYQHLLGSFSDGDAVREFAKMCGVVTVEIEHVDADTLEELERQGVDCEPKASTIRIIQTSLSGLERLCPVTCDINQLLKVPCTVQTLTVAMQTLTSMISSVLNF